MHECVALIRRLHSAGAWPESGLRAPASGAACGRPDPEGTASEHYRLALEMVKQVGAMFSWVTIGYVYECMDECDSLVYPNGGFDSTHPSDGGQSVIAMEVFRSVVERFAKIGKS